MAQIEPVYFRLGDRLRAIREERRLTQEDLALRAGLNRAYVGFIERAERGASLTTLGRLAEVLGVELIELFDFNS